MNKPYYAVELWDKYANRWDRVGINCTTEDTARAIAKWRSTQFPGNTYSYSLIEEDVDRILYRHGKVVSGV